jgi:maleylpyruvate isomerase
MTSAPLFDPQDTAQLIATLHDAHEMYRKHLEKLPAESFSRPTVLPNWKNAHVIAHVDGFSRGVLNQLDAAEKHEFRDFIEGGQDERNRRIELGALMQPEALRERALESLDAVLEKLGSADSNYLDRAIRFQGSIRRLVLACIREFAVHSTDLTQAAQPLDWTQPMVRHFIDFAEQRVPETLKLNIQPIGGQSHSIGHGHDTVVVQGMDFDIAAWLMGRQPAGQVRATAAADGVSLPDLLPWPRPKILTPEEERALGQN